MANLRSKIAEAIGISMPNTIASPAYLVPGALHNLQHGRYPGGHALTKERFDFIIEWMEAKS